MIDYDKIFIDIEFTKKRRLERKYPLLYRYKGLSTIKPLSKTYLLLCRKKKEMLWGFHFIFTERAVWGVYNFERKQFIICVYNTI